MKTQNSTPPAPYLMTEAEAAHYLTVSVGALRAWRGAGTGPAYRKIGAAVRYTADDLDRYLLAVTVEPERAK